MRGLSRLSFFTLLLGLDLAAVQTGGRGRGGGQNRQQPLEVLPNFTGVLTSVDKKKLTIEGEEANSLEFNRTRKTKYYSGSKSINGTALKPGEKVSIEARRAPDGTLDAVNVRLEEKKQQPPQ